MDKILFLSIILTLSLGSCGQNKTQSAESNTENVTTDNQRPQSASESIVQTAIDRSDVPKVTVEEAIALAEKGYQFVDLRTPKEIAEGKIEGALEMNIRNNTFKRDVNELDANSKLILYCQSGTRSESAAKFFSEIQFQNVVDMTGGYSAWVEYHNR